MTKRKGGANLQKNELFGLNNPKKSLRVFALEILLQILQIFVIIYLYSFDVKGI